jgi:hypothetical protein
MSKSFFAMLGVAGALALSGVAAAPASAMEPGKHIAAPHSTTVQVRQFNRAGVRHLNRERRFHRGFRRGFYIAPVYGYRYYNDDCYWLKRKAIRTGSRYWWRRYHECRWG